MVRYRDLPAVHFAPPPSGRIELPEGAKIGGLFISPRGQVHWTYYQQRASTMLAADGRQVDLRAPGGREFRFPQVQQFSDSRWLVIESRTDAETANAFVFDPDGILIHSFYAGDGIETAIIDKRNRIWIGYFDEGVFGTFRRQGPARNHSCFGYGPSGLIRLSEQGEIEFAYNGRLGGTLEKSISDIYALTIDDEDRAWFCPYTEFFVASVLDDRVDYVLTRAPTTGAHALSVGPHHFVFFGGYKRSSMIAFVDRTSLRLRLLQLRGDDGGTLSPVRIATRGRGAMAVANNQLYRLDQDILLEALGPWTDDNTSTLESALQYQNEEASYADSWIVYGVGPADRRIPGKPRPPENQPRNDEDTKR